MVWMAALLATFGGSSGPSLVDGVPDPRSSTAPPADALAVGFIERNAPEAGTSATGLRYGSGFEARSRSRPGAAASPTEPANGPAAEHVPAPGAPRGDPASDCDNPGANPTQQPQG